MDLKKFNVIYSVAFPSIHSNNPIILTKQPQLYTLTPTQVPSITPIDHNNNIILNTVHSRCSRWCWLDVTDSDNTIIYPITKFIHTPPSIAAKDRLIYLMLEDLCTDHTTLSWTLRNALFALQWWWGSESRSSSDKDKGGVGNVVCDGCVCNGCVCDGCVCDDKFDLNVISIKKNNHTVFYQLKIPKNAFYEKMDTGRMDTPRTLPMECVADGWVTTFRKRPGQAKGDLSLRETVVFETCMSRFLDPIALQAFAVDLNLKLMKWRIAPDINVAAISVRKYLLLGSGTLGCSVARLLLAWGASHITLVDGGRVSMSNPVRQTLFTHEDATFDNCQGRYKAEAACMALKRIRPDIHASHYNINIPVPGDTHTHTDTQLKETINKLIELISTHDIIFMLTDNRESRWLPSFIVNILNCSYHTHTHDEYLIKYNLNENNLNENNLNENNLNENNLNKNITPPLAVTVALGFDTFLIISHAYTPTTVASHLGGPLGCYFCNSTTSPHETGETLTLDRQCTVTRPGVSSMASAIAVELVASLCQDIRGPLYTHTHTHTHSVKSPLGATPNTIRGTLKNYSIDGSNTERFPYCVCCSDSIVNRGADDYDFIIQALKTPELIGRSSGLEGFIKKMDEHTHAHMAMVEGDTDDDAIF
eukprot:GHVR01180767.1.p1 GENE.GHVR01180767.1~~GHVR01180767.1.p1  ORF type:complete len:648 (+),score=192.85 GHVR01180767.1:116-2059(+)